MFNFTDDQLVHIAKYPCSINDIETLRILEKIAKLVIKNFTDDDCMYIADLLSSDWSHVLVRLIDYQENKRDLIELSQVYSESCRMVENY